MNRKWMAATVAGAMGLMVLGGGLTAAGILIGLNWAPSPSIPMSVHADAASRSEDVSFATGLITDDVEGLFVLDHQTGLLQCWLVNRQNGQVGAIFRADPATDMELEKAVDADFVMTTGGINFIGNFQTGNQKPARTICYVGDGNSGKVIGYTMRINQAALNARATQQGMLEIVCRGLIRESSMIRDQ